MNNFGEKVNFIWSVADLIRDTFKRSKYQDVILPFTVLRRIDCVLQPTKERVLEINYRLQGSDQGGVWLCPALADDGRRERTPLLAGEKPLWVRPYF